MVVKLENTCGTCPAAVGYTFVAESKLAKIETSLVELLFSAEKQPAGKPVGTAFTNRIIETSLVLLYSR